MVIDGVKISILTQGVDSLVKILDDAIILTIGAEIIKMLCKHTPETVIEVITFALARQLIVGHSSALENLVTVIVIAVLFAARRFLLNKKDMVKHSIAFWK